MKPRFEPDLNPAKNSPVPSLIGHGKYDASEQEFAASPDRKPEPRFVVDDESAGGTRRESAQGEEIAGSQIFQKQDIPADENLSGKKVMPAGNSDLAPPEPEPATNVNCPPVAPDSWRKEVAAKMNHYRAQKRPRAPRYPSLQLRFEALESGAAVRALTSDPDGYESEDRLPSSKQMESPRAHLEPRSVEESFSDSPIPAGKIIEFPVFSAPPPPRIDELAEPVLDRPRILEVPEVIPPPPALGGILIEPAEETSREKRQGFELPLIAAPFSRRILAGGVDALIVASAFALFAYTFFRITGLIPPLRQSASIAGALLAVFWAGYQYLMLVHAGTTAGLKLAKLRLNRFDGTHVPCKLRRWRVLASLLSGLSLGLGYSWCFLDEDQLCWHDRITHTYMAPAIPT